MSFSSSSSISCLVDLDVHVTHIDIWILDEIDSKYDEQWQQWDRRMCCNSVLSAALSDFHVEKWLNCMALNWIDSQPPHTTKQTTAVKISKILMSAVLDDIPNWILVILVLQKNRRVLENTKDRRGEASRVSPIHAAIYFRRLLSYIARWHLKCSTFLLFIPFDSSHVVFWIFQSFFNLSSSLNSQFLPSTTARKQVKFEKSRLWWRVRSKMIDKK